MIEARGLRVRHATGPELGPWDLQHDAGQLVLHGASGSGKTTLLRALAGIHPHVLQAEVSGHVAVAGAEPGSRRPHERPGAVGYAPQDAASTSPTPWQEVAWPLEQARWPRQETRHRVDELLGILELTRHAGTHASRLSGGQQALVQLAAALAARPRVLLLDEPLAQLDSDARARARRALGHTGAQATLVASHRPELWPGARVVDLDPERPPPLVRVSPASGPELARVQEAHAAGRATDALDLRVHRGEAVALDGANGAGKTTLLWLLCGLLRPAQGQVRVAGQDPWRWSAVQRAQRCGLSFQDPAWHVTQDTVWQEACLTLSTLGGPTAAAETWLRRFGLWALRHRHPWDLSGGQRQRLAVVTALAHGPDLALLDEPTRGMDARHRAWLVLALQARCDAGKATVVASHDEALRDALGRTERLQPPDPEPRPPERRERPAQSGHRAARPGRVAGAASRRPPP